MAALESCRAAPRGGSWRALLPCPVVLIVVIYPLEKPRASGIPGGEDNTVQTRPPELGSKLPVLLPPPWLLSETRRCTDGRRASFTRCALEAPRSRVRRGQRGAFPGTGRRVRRSTDAPPLLPAGKLTDNFKHVSVDLYLDTDAEGKTSVVVSRAPPGDTGGGGGGRAARGALRGGPGAS